MERLIDYAAAEIGIDRIELRRRNHIRQREMPCKAAVRHAPTTAAISRRVLKHALDAADVQGLQRSASARARSAASCAASASAAFSKSPRRPTRKWAASRFDADGDVTILTGTLDFGKGHATPFAQVLSEKLGVPFEKIRLLQGDSDELLAGGGTGGSSSMMHQRHGDRRSRRQGDRAGQADRLARAGSRRPATSSSGTASSSSPAPTARSASWSWRRSSAPASSLPPDAPQSLDVKHVSDGRAPSAFPNGCHVCRGRDRSRHRRDRGGEIFRGQRFRHRRQSDAGRRARCMAAWCRASARRLLEHVVYDRQGQLLTGSFMDYAHAARRTTRRTSSVVAIRCRPRPIRSASRAAAKPAAPARCTSIMNAVVDALSDYGIRHIDMPASPARVWQAIQDAKTKS